MSDIKHEIVNMVAAAELGTSVNLIDLAVALPDVEFEPEQFPGAIVRLSEPKSTLLVFGNGKIVCTGANTEELVGKAIEQFIKILKKNMPELELHPKPFEVYNMVAASELHRKIDLYTLAVESSLVEYEAEQFPGAIIRLGDPNVVILLFRTGKLICAGAKSRADIEKAILKTSQLVQDVLGE